MIHADFINDDTYKCNDCEEEFQVFSKSGGMTNFVQCVLVEILNQLRRRMNNDNWRMS